MKIMKINIIALSLLSLLSFGSCSQTDRTIAFYNIENLFDTINSPSTNDSEYLPNASKKWDSGKYFEKIKHINEVVAKLNSPIILGLCEIENEQVVRDVVRGGPMKDHYGVVHFQSLDKRGIDNAIIYDSSLLKLTSKGIVRFDMPEGFTPSRDIVWAKFKNKDTEILTMVNHWPSRSGGQVISEPKRLVAAVAARTFIDSVLSASPDMNIVFMGDLNDYPDNIAPKMISSTLKPMITAKSGKFGGSHNYRGEWNVLDYIMISSKFSKNKNSISVIKNSGKIHSYDFLLSTYKGNIVPFRTFGGKKYLAGYSDHLPVTIGIKIK